MMKQNKTFVVLGMHRSGSSAVAKAFHESRIIHMGDSLLCHGKGNPEGHYEDWDFIHKNQQLMNGDYWYKPNIKLREDVDTKELIDKKNIKPMWGWKDPRTSLTIDKYYDYIDDPIIVALFRDPKKVGESLHKRDGSDIKKGEKLAKAYNAKIIDFLMRRFL